MWFRWKRKSASNLIVSDPDSVVQHHEGHRPVDEGFAEWVTPRSAKDLGQRLLHHPERQGPVEVVVEDQNGARPLEAVSSEF